MFYNHKSYKHTVLGLAYRVKGKFITSHFICEFFDLKCIRKLVSTYFWIHISSMYLILQWNY